VADQPAYSKVLCTDCLPAILGFCVHFCVVILTFPVSGFLFFELLFRLLPFPVLLRSNIRLLRGVASKAVKIYGLRFPCWLYSAYIQEWGKGGKQDTECNKKIFFMPSLATISLTTKRKFGEVRTKKNNINTSSDPWLTVL
jgi:hypothetical protein